MNLSLDWSTLNKRLQDYGENSADDDTVLGDNVSLVPVEGAGRGLRAERDLAGGQVMSVRNLPTVPPVPTSSIT